MAAALIAPAPAGSMEVYEISPAVNRVANDAHGAAPEPYSIGLADAAARRRAEARAQGCGLPGQTPGRARCSNRVRLA